MDAELTLEEAKTLDRQREAMHEQQQVLKGGDKDTQSTIAFVGKSLSKGGGLEESHKTKRSRMHVGAEKETWKGFP